jgi:hypothetical protein
MKRLALCPIDAAMESAYRLEEKNCTASKFVPIRRVSGSFMPRFLNVNSKKAR